VWSFIYYIAVLSCHHSDYIAYSGYFKLSMYTWIFFSRIYVIDSRRVSVSTYFGKRSVTGFFFVLEPSSTFDFWHRPNLILTDNLRQVIFILRYTYIINTMVLSPLENWPSSLWISISLILWYPWFQFFF